MNIINKVLLENEAIKRVEEMDLETNEKKRYSGQRKHTMFRE